jgi:molybdenum cofactor cytidylyltransferase
VIWALILAAGESRRMGTQKLLLPFGETTIVGAVARTATASRVDRTLVVLGADRDAVRKELEPPVKAGPAEVLGANGKTAPGPGRGLSPSSDPSDADSVRGFRKIEFTVNDDYRIGMLTSIQAGLRALPADAEAAVIMLGDQPFLPSRVVDEIIAAYEAGRHGIVIPTFQGRRGHPVLIDLKYRDEVLALDPCAGLRALMCGHPADIIEVDVADADILRDLDTPEDYAGRRGADS